MADDLMKCLRTTPLYESSGEESALPEQAADEIKRLRKALRDIVAVDGSDQMVGIARAALSASAPRNADRSGDGEADSLKPDIDTIIRDLCELSGDADPEQDDALTVTVEEVRIILTRHLDPEHA
jgi:hypothetical protein